MDDIDRRLLQLAQQGLPLTPQPYLSLGNELGLSETEVIQRLQSLVTDGIVRRVGGVFDSKSLGYVSALCAIKADINEVDRLAAIISQYPGVTHNYLRDDPRLNLWFTLTCASLAEFELTISELETKMGIKVHRYPVCRRYKIKFYLPLKTDDSTMST